MEPLSISGPTGALEAMLRTPLVAGGELAILCHPHPLYGGSMHDAVLDLVGQTLSELSINCLTFNFRGVGASEGSFDNGRGEAEDLLAVVEWVREQNVQSPWLGGYSFGAHVVCRALPQVPDPSRVLLVAPPTAAMDIPQPPASFTVDVFAGDRDDFVDLDKLADWNDARLHIIADADHFFGGCARRLRETVAQAHSQRGTRSVVFDLGASGSSDIASNKDRMIGEAFGEAKKPRTEAT